MSLITSMMGAIGYIVIITLIICLGFIIPWILTHFSWNSKTSKVQKYLNFVLYTLLLIFTVGIITMCIYWETHTYSDSSSSNKEDGFTIESYNVKMDVGEDNVVDVVETIEVDFYESNHHGIYRTIPTTLDYTAKDGKTVSRRAIISNLKAIGDNYSLETVNGKKKIKIGSKDYTLSTGTKIYKISYQYDMGKDPFDGFDEFIFHSFGDYWNTKIKNASIEVTMPKSFDEDSIRFFTDKNRENDITSSVNYYVLGNTLYASVSLNVSLTKALTLDISLPDGYFTSTKDNNGYTSMILCILIIIFMIISFIKWLKYGKDNKKQLDTVEFYPPCGYDSAEIAYIHENSIGIKSAIALIIELAGKGFVKIHEVDKKIIIEKNKEKQDLSSMTKNEQIVYEQLFIEHEQNILSEDKKFGGVVSELTDNLYKNLTDKIFDVNSYKNIKIVISLLYVSCGYLLASFAFVADLNPKYNILYSLAVISIIIMFVLAILMKRKSEYGEELSAKIKGFKHYLEVVEKGKLNELVNDNPMYFYDILPYAYVLGVSKKWIEKFENIQMPQCDMGSFNFSNVDSINIIASSCSSSSGGCSSCGGCGGGCGGGGSW